MNNWGELGVTGVTRNETFSTGSVGGSTGEGVESLRTEPRASESIVPNEVIHSFHRAVDNFGRPVDNPAHSIREPSAPTIAGRASERAISGYAREPGLSWRPF